MSSRRIRLAALRSLTPDERDLFGSNIVCEDFIDATDNRVREDAT